MNKVLLITVAILSMAVWACGKAEQSEAPAEVRKEAPASASTLPANAQAEAKSMLDGYDAVHAKLAADSTDGVNAAAIRMQESATKASAAVPSNLQPHFQAVASAAAKLTQTPATDIEATRKAFAEVSSKVVALLSVEPSLAAGRLVFECPMTPNYKKWIQTSAPIRNPNYGKQMLECGEASDWKV